jgi:hypothetical protein
MLSARAVHAVTVAPHNPIRCPFSAVAVAAVLHLLLLYPPDALAMVSQQMHMSKSGSSMTRQCVRVIGVAAIGAGAFLSVPLSLALFLFFPFPILSGW